MNYKHQTVLESCNSHLGASGILMLLIMSISGCDKFHQSNTGGEISKANYICNGLITKFINNERHFNRIKKASDDSLVRYFCVWRKGLELPKGKEHWETLIDDKITIFDKPLKTSRSEQ